MFFRIRSFLARQRLCACCFVSTVCVVQELPWDVWAIGSILPSAHYLLDHDHKSLHAATIIHEHAACRCSHPATIIYKHVACRGSHCIECRGVRLQKSQRGIKDKVHFQDSASTSCSSRQFESVRYLPLYSIGITSSIGKLSLLQEFIQKMQLSNDR